MLKERWVKVLVKSVFKFHIWLLPFHLKREKIYTWEACYNIQLYPHAETQNKFLKSSSLDVFLKIAFWLQAFSTFPCTDWYRKRLVENVTSVATSDENFLYFCHPHSRWNPSCCYALKLVFNDISILYSNSLSTVPKKKRSSPAAVKEMRKFKI